MDALGNAAPSGGSQNPTRTVEGRGSSFSELCEPHVPAGISDPGPGVAVARADLRPRSAAGARKRQVGAGVGLSPEDKNELMPASHVYIVWSGRVPRKDRPESSHVQLKGAS